MTSTMTPVPASPNKNRQGSNVRQRSAQVGVRLLPHEMEQLRQVAERQQLSPAEVLRRAFMQAVTP